GPLSARSVRACWTYAPRTVDKTRNRSSLDGIRKVVVSVVAFERSLLRVAVSGRKGSNPCAELVIGVDDRWTVFFNEIHAFDNMCAESLVKFLFLVFFHCALPDH